MSIYFAFLKTYFKHIFPDNKKIFLVTLIIAKRFCQDPLELFIGKIRAMGSNDHPSSLEFQYRMRKYILGRGGYMPTTGNVSEDVEDCTVEMALDPAYSQLDFDSAVELSELTAERILVS